MSMKRIVFIIDSLSGGGAERIVLTLASTLNHIGHEGIILTLSNDVEHEFPEQIRVITAPEPPKVLGNLGRRKRHAAELQKQLDQLHNEAPIDLIISNLPKTDRIVKYTRGYNRYFCIHNTYSVEYLDNKTGLSRWRKHQQLSKVYQGESLIAVSNGVLNDVQETLKLPVKSITRIYNPFDIDWLKSRSSQTPKIDYGDYIIHVGRINRQKRHDRLLRAFKTSNISEHIKLVLLGNGAEKETAQLKSTITDMGLESSVLLHGFDTNPYPYIKNAKATVLSSDFEGLPTVLIESLICGTPVVSTDCPSGPDEILTGELANYLVSTEDEQALADKISDICNNPPIVDENYYRHFSAELITKQYVDLID